MKSEEKSLNFLDGHVKPNMLNVSCSDGQLGFPFNTKQNTQIVQDYPMHIPVTLSFQ